MNLSRKNQPLVVPEHITVIDQKVRILTGFCKTCRARVDMGEYPEPEKADELFAQWVQRHAHDERFK